jgi:hypothetical protein
MRRSVLRVTWEAVRVVEGYYNTCWLMGIWSTQAKAEAIVLKAA